jgi:hypothetical protein
VAEAGTRNLARDEDGFTTPRAQQVEECALRPPDPDNVDVDDRGKFLLTHVHERASSVKAGKVDDRVDATGLHRSRCDRCLFDAPRVGHVTHQWTEAIAHLERELVKRVRAAVDSDDCDSFVYEPLRCCEPEAGSGTRNEHARRRTCGVMRSIARRTRSAIKRAQRRAALHFEYL